ncbi:MAG: hypothetical protein WC608_02125 [Parcubacteria group bacterium]
MEKEPKFLNTNKEIKNESLVNQDVLVRKLNELLKEKKLSATTIEQESKNLGITFAKLGYLIFFESGLSDEFYNYSKELEGNKFYSNEEIRDLIASFLEKIQQKSEPAKVEQEPQPIAEPPQAPKAQKLIGYEKTEETVEVVPQPERKNWREVKRETEVMAVEDLSGDMKTFEKHVKKLGVAKKDASGHWQWTGGNKKLVFLGDILGDRGMDGIEITSIIGDLADQAVKQKGKVDFLCGNHDMDLIYFLCKAGKDDYAEKNAELFTDQNMGIWELTEFDQDFNSELRKVKPFTKDFRKREEDLWSKLYEKMPEILANMRTNPRGRKILESICQIKVAVIYDDTLFCHTDPTSKMVSDLVRNRNIKQRVLEINKIFQRDLRGVLLDGEKWSDELNLLDKLYLSADNRDYFVEQEFGVQKMESIKRVRDSGVNAIIHGHSPGYERYYDKNELIIFSPHGTFPDESEEERGISIVKKNGKIKLSGKSFRK